jgi:hypothetical protein
MRFFMFATMMSTEVLRRVTPSATPVGTAVLRGWRTDFLRPSKAGGGAMGIVESGAEAVHGVLFDVAEAEVEPLDALELGAMYHRVEIDVERPDGSRERVFTYKPVPEPGFPFAPRPDYVQKMEVGVAEHGVDPAALEMVRASAERAASPHVYEAPRATPVVRDVDVIVVGGGISGVVAAVAAARQGAKTVLLERFGFLGGDGINCGTGLHSFFNVYQHEPKTDRVQLVGGIPWEIAERLVAAEGSLGHVEMEVGGKYLSVLTPVDPEVFKDVALQLCAEAGVEVLFHSWVADTVVEQGRIRGVIVESRSGREALLAKAVVDCSGDGDVAAAAGAELTHRRGETNWGMSLTFRLANVDLDRAAAQIGAADQVFQLAHATRFGEDEPHVCRLAVDMNSAWTEAVAKWGTRGRFLATSIHAGEATQMNCTMYGPVDPLSRDELSQAEAGLRSQLRAVVGFLRENIDGFERCHPVASSAAAGVRRSRIVHGRYEMTADDLVSGRDFDDAVGLFGLIDDKQTFVEGNGHYGIPYRCLLPVGVEGLLVAGRTVGQDDLVHTSTRMMANCMVQGQGAGTAAALAALGDVLPSELDVASLRAALVEADVILQT